MSLRITLFLTYFLYVSTSVFAQTPFESLNFIYSIKGQSILSGQHNDQKNLDCFGGGATGPSYWTDQVYNITGKYPALWGGDLLFHGSEQLRWDMTYEAERQWNAGAIVNIMWHACPPTQGASCNWDGGLLSALSAQQFTELLTDGSNLNNTWKSRVDEIAVHLQYLKEAGVEVFWRPYHEQNQSAFWWNSQGAGNTQALWRMMHDYMTNDLGLNNLVWIWDVQDIGGRTNYWDWNPGNEYWDILALDIYSDAYWNSEYYNNMRTAAGNKPIAIGECFNLPSASTINTYPEYTFFMNWAYGLKKGLSCENTNSDAYIREVYNNPKVLTRDEMPGWGKSFVSANLATGKTITVSSTEVGNNIVSNINDQNLNTRWSSQYTDNEWLVIDLESEYELDSLRITWEAAYASAYTIQVSLDNTNWTTIESINNNSTLANFFGQLTSTARYVRINGISRATAFGYSIYELEIYGKRILEAYQNSPITIPGIVEAEYYAEGGEGIAYHDETEGNAFAAFRDDDVDIGTTADIDGGFSIGAIETGEWIKYVVNVSNSGLYDFSFRVASLGGGGNIQVLLDDQEIIASVPISATGGWQVWGNEMVTGINLEAGEQVLTVYAATGNFNFNKIEVSPSVTTNTSSSLIAQKFEVFPNPILDQNINYEVSIPASQVTITLSSVVGNVVFESTKVVSGGHTKGVINSGVLNSGIYILQIEGEGHIRTAKVLVQ